MDIRRHPAIDKAMPSFVTEMITIGNIPVDPESSLEGPRKRSIWTIVLRWIEVKKALLIKNPFLSFNEAKSSRNVDAAESIVRFFRKRLGYFHDDSDVNHDGHGAAEVLKTDLNLRHSFSVADIASPPREYEPTQINSWSFGCDSSVSGDFSGISSNARRTSETDCENAKDSSENRDYYSPKSGNDGIFVRDISPNAVPIRWDHADENGDAFFKMLGGWIVLAIGFYALLKLQ